MSTSTGFGTILGTSTLRFDRLLPCPIEGARDYLSKPQWIAKWRAEVTLELRRRGAGRAPFDVEEVLKRMYGDAYVPSQLPPYKPLDVLAYSWEQSDVTFKLKLGGCETQLTLFHRHLPSSLLVKCGAGWHAHLDILAARLSNKAPTAFQVRFQSLLPLYEWQFDEAEIPAKELQSRLLYIGPKLARNLVQSGITTEEELATYDLEALCKKMATHSDFKPNGRAKGLLKAALQSLQS